MNSGAVNRAGDIKAIFNNANYLSDVNGDVNNSYTNDDANSCVNAALVYNVLMLINIWTADVIAISV